jgi:hypothetical protein
MNKNLRVLVVGILATLPHFSALAATQAPNPVVSENSPWKDLAQPIAPFKGKDINALAVVGDKLLVATTSRSFEHEKKLFSYGLKSGDLTDVTFRLSSGPADTVTAIMVNPKHSEIWVSTNNNIFSSLCYDLNLKLKVPADCDQSFLDKTISHYVRIGGAKNGAIVTSAFDDSAEIQGEFKGGIYLQTRSPNEEVKRRKVYQPADRFHAPCASLLLPETALVGTNGDGLIVIKRGDFAVKRFPDKDYSYVMSMASFGDRLFIGSDGLFQAKLSDFTP